MSLLLGSVGLARTPCCHSLPTYRASLATLSQRVEARCLHSRFPAQQAARDRGCRLHSATQVREGAEATGPPSHEPQQPAAARK